MIVVVGRAALLALVFSCAGCSFIFVSGKPANAEVLPPSEPVDCTTSKAAPVLDTVFAGLEVARTGYAVSLKDSDYHGQTLTRGADIGLGLAFVALFASSAIYGYVTTGSCANAKDQHERARQQYLTPVGPAVPSPVAPSNGYPAQLAPSAAPPSSAPVPAPEAPARPPAPTPAPANTVPSNAFPPAS